MSKDDGNNDCNCGQNPDPLPPAPPPPSCVGCGSGGGGNSNNQPPHDPNDLLGPSGYGSAGYLTPGGALPYTIEFSNEKTAEVPADNVVVTEQLSPNMDWSTFQLDTIGFGNYIVNVPPGLTSYSTRVDATATLGVYVDIDASLNLSTGLLTVTFTSLDPTTLDTPSNPLVGFLPPDTNPPNGEGFINYTIQPKAGLATGAAIDAQASIVFDTNAPLATPQIVNTIDAGPPTSAVAALPATTTTPSFTVFWSGFDGAGPGIAGYNVYVSDDGGFTLWQSDTSATSATYTGQAGHTYEFYSVATDNLGHVQPTPRAAQATITVKVPTVTPTPTPTPPPTIIGEQVLFSRKLNKHGTPTRKPVLSGFELEFSAAMNAATAGNASNYQLGWTSTKKVKKHVVTILHPVAFHVQYSDSNDSVSLLLDGKEAFAKGGQITVIAAAPDGVSSASGVLLDGNDEGVAGDDGVFTILPKARGITRG